MKFYVESGSTQNLVVCVLVHLVLNIPHDVWHKRDHNITVY